MARTPRATVSKTSGQGISRLSYQKGYKLKGAGPDIKGPGKTDSGSSRSYAKSETKAYNTGDFNVSYGDTLFPTDLKDLEDFGREKPMKSGIPNQRSAAKRLK